MNASYFYSRPCGRGDFDEKLKYCPHCISTHAPAGGATYLNGYTLYVVEISTHAPAGGATISISTSRG